MNMNIGIRAAQPGERIELEELQRRASLANERDREHLLADPGLIHLPLSQLQEKRIRVAEIAGRIVGFSAVLPKTAQVFELDGLFVEPDRWRSGIGRALVVDAFQCVTAQGGTSLEVVANDAAEAFYEKLGFERSALVETLFRPAWLMRRHLC